MSCLFYIINVILFFLYTQTSNYFYSIIYQTKRNRRGYILLIILQLVSSIAYPFLKEKNSLDASLMSYIIFFLGNFIYTSSIKQKIIHFFFLVGVNICGEMLSSSCLILFLSLILNVKVTFLDSLFKTNQMYYLLGLFGAVSVIYIVMRYIGFLSTKVNKEQLNKIIVICFFPLVVAFTFLNVIYPANKNIYWLLVIISWIAILGAIYLLLKELEKFQSLQKENIENSLKKRILDEQIKQMNLIDQYYRKIRKETHDFKNHSLIVLNMLENKDIKVKEYLLSMKNNYQEEDDEL